MNGVGWGWAGELGWGGGWVGQRHEQTRPHQAPHQPPGVPSMAGRPTGWLPHSPLHYAAVVDAIAVEAIRHCVIVGVEGRSQVKVVPLQQAAASWGGSQLVGWWGVREPTSQPKTLPCNSQQEHSKQRPSTQVHPPATA